MSVASMLALLLTMATCLASDFTCAHTETAADSFPIDADPEVGENLHLLQTGLSTHSINAGIDRGSHHTQGNHLVWGDKGGGRAQVGGSQAGQDVALRPILSNIRNGFFVEAGAFDGVKDSNTVLLDDQGWTGLLVEPDPVTFRALQNNNRKAWLFHGALSLTDATQTCTFKTGGNDLYARTQGGITIKGFADSHAYNVSCVPLQSLLDSLHQSTVDYFSLDIEGGELPVLKTIDFDKIEIGILDVEVINTADYPNHPDKEELHSFVLSKGFHHIGGVTTEEGDEQDRFYANPRYFLKRGLPLPKAI